MAPSKHFFYSFVARFSAIVDRLNYISVVTSGSLVLVAVGMSTYAIIRRGALLFLPRGWSLEVGELLLLLMTYLGASYLLSKGRHVTVELVTSRLHGKTSLVVSTITLLLIVFVAILIAWRGATLSTELISVKRLTELRTPIYAVAVFVPLVGILLVLQAIAQIFSLLTSGGNNKGQCPGNYNS